MTAIRYVHVFSSKLPRLHVWMLLSALAATVGLATWMTSTDARIATLDRATLHGHNSQLESMSARAERLQAYSQHIRKVSLTTPSEVELPYGGYVGSADHVAPGASLKLEGTEPGRQILEVVSADRISPSVGLAAAPERQIELMLVTGRLLGTEDARLVRFLVSVSPTKQPGATEHQSL